MKSLQDDFLRVARAASVRLGSLGLPVVQPAGTTTQNLFQRFTALASKDKQKAVGVAWAFLLVVMIVITAVIVPGIGAIRASQAVAVGVLSPIWGVVIGMGVALFLPAKWLTAIAGALFGLDANELSGTGILEHVVKAIQTLTAQLGTWAGLGAPDLVAVRWYVVLFVAAFMAACLPGFARDN
jgi:hypothetical protein